MKQLDEIKQRVFQKQQKITELNLITDLMREFSCVSDIIGRDFEVEVMGHIVCRIHQKPMKILQLNTLLEELAVLRKMEADEMKKSVKKSRRGR